MINGMNGRNINSDSRFMNSNNVMGTQKNKRYFSFWLPLNLYRALVSDCEAVIYGRP